MADNTTLNTGSGGDVIATDDIAGVKYQRVKITLGADGVNDGDVASGNLLPVDASGATVPVSNAGLTELAAAINASRVDVNLAASAATVTVDGSGVTQPISAASLPLPTGAATAANQLPDGHNVTVDNASIAITAAALPLPTGAATAANQLPDGHNVTIDNAAGGSAVNIQDGGNSITVDNAALTNLDSALDVESGVIDGTTNGILLQGDDGTNRKNVAVDPGTGNIQADVSNDDRVDNNNSTTAPLGGGATFTGAAADVLDYSTVTVTLYADQDSATDGMQFQFSTDATNWDDSYDFTMTGGETRRFQFPVCARYFRIVYTNGATPQGAFRVQTLLKTQNTNTSIHRIEDNISTDRSATLVKAGLIAQVNGSGDFIPIQANAAGILKVGGSVDVDDISAGTQTNDVKVTLDGETVTIGAAIPAGTNAIGDVGLEPRTSGGTSIFRSIDLDETEEQIKATAGQVYWIMAFNVSTGVRYLKFYNATAATVVVGTTTPVLTIPIPTQAATANGAGFMLAIPHGVEFDTAITVAATTGVADADTGAPGANEVIVNIGYA